MTQILKILTVVALCAMATSCKDSHDGPTLAIYQNIVTFVGNSNNKVNFEFQELDDSPVVRLSVTGQLNEVDPGTRLLMTYSLPSDATYGENCSEITLRGLQKIYTGTVSILPYSAAERYDYPVALLTIYRTGHYLNLTANMPAVDGREYIMAAASESIAGGNVDLYLTTSPQSSTTATYNTRQVASIDISPVWEKEEVRSVTVHVNNSQNPNSTEFTFKK